MNIIRINVDPEVLATGAFGAGALVRVERSSARDSGYAEAGTVAIVAVTTPATFYDSSGTIAHWYRTRYSNATNTTHSDYGAPFQATSDGYATLSDVKARLGLGTAAGTADPLLTTIVSEVNAWLDGKLGRRVGPGGSATRTYDGDGSPVLFIRDGIQQVYTLTVYDGTGGTSYSVPSTDYYLDPPEGDRRPGFPAFYVQFSDAPTGTHARFPRGKRTVSLTAEWGWPAVPLDLQAIASKCAISEWRARASAGGDTYTIGVNGERTYERFLSWEDRATLGRYAVNTPGVA